MKRALLDPVDAVLTAVAVLQPRAGADGARHLSRIEAAASNFRALVDALPAVEGASPEVFTRTVTHDLLNPLNQIIGYAEMAAEELEDGSAPGDADGIAQLHWIAATARRLTTQVEVAAGRTPASVAPGAAVPVDPLVPIPAAGGAALPGPPPGPLAATRLPTSTNPLLVVDDDPLNRDMLAQRLQRQGFVVLCAEHGLAALDILEAQPIDLVLLDVLMPHMDGYEVLARMQANPALKDVPVLMVSGLSEIESVVRCIEMGATDYLTKPFNPVLLQARIGASLEKKQLRDQERRTFLALEASQRALAAELAEAADYVRSLLPLPSTQAGVSVDWRFRPSMQLGGDAFGFQWLDPDHLSVYLFDVCGHGVGAALLSVGIIEALRSRRLGAVDMRDPSAVLGALNDAFPMELHNGQYFTMWYGVYQRRTRTLVHASGGHPAAQLVTRAHGGVTCVPVWHPGLIVGGMPDVIYGHATVAVPAGSRLYVFSDGLFEIAGPDGRMLPYERFVELFTEPVPAGKPALDHIIDWVRGFASDRFDDDVSILELTFD